MHKDIVVNCVVGGFVLLLVVLIPMLVVIAPAVFGLYCVGLIVRGLFGLRD